MFQNEFDRLQFTEQPVDGASLIPTVVARVANKFKERFNVVRRLKIAAESAYARSHSSPRQWECCKVKHSSDNLEYDSRFRQKVDLSKGCIAISESVSSNRRYLDASFVTEMRQILIDYPFIKWQYFGTEQGVLTNYPGFAGFTDCSNYDPRYRPWYVETATPEPKDVVVVIDRSGSMGTSRMNIAKEAAITVLSTMNPRDRVGKPLISIVIY